MIELWNKHSDITYNKYTTIFAFHNDYSLVLAKGYSVTLENMTQVIDENDQIKSTTKDVMAQETMECANVVNIRHHLLDA